MGEKVTAITTTNGDGSVDAGVLKTFAGRVERAKRNVDEQREFQNEIYKAVDAAGIHRQALKAVLKLKGMESSQAQDFMRAFDSYAHILGLHDQTDLLDDATAAE